MNHMKKLYQKTLVPSFKNRAQINKIAKLLLKYFNINYFYFADVRSNGDYCYFSSRMDWIEHLFENSEHLELLPLMKPINYKKGSGIKVLSEEKINLDSRKFDIQYVYEFIDVTAKGIEYFGFAMPPTVKNPVDKLINDAALLKIFYNQIRKKYASIFEDAKNNYQDIKPAFKGNFNKPDYCLAPSLNKSDFLKLIDFDFNYCLSKREEMVAVLLIRGYSAAEIAHQLNLSKRTVESYLVTMKCKLNSYSKSDLIKKCIELETINYFS